MKILLLGGTGVLSKDIALHILSQGDNVYLLNRGNNRKDIPQHDKCHLIIGNIRDTEGIKRLMKDQDFDVVVDFLSFNSTHLQNTYGIFASKCKQYIFISSCCVFRRSEEDGVISENSPKPNTKLPYSIEKYDCEVLLKEISKFYPCKFTIVRPYITYGETRIPYGLSPLERYHWTLIGRILSGKPFFMWNDGSNRCSLLNTKDFAKIFYQLLLNSKAFNEDINITSNSNYTWKQVIEELYKILGSDVNNVVYIPQDDIVKQLPEYKESLLGDRSLNGIFDNSKLLMIAPKAKSILDNSITLHDGLVSTIDSYKQNNYYRGIDYRYDARIDRMLSRYIKTNDKRRKCIRFVDYLGNARKKDIAIYLFFRYSSDWLIDVLRKFKKYI